MAEDYHLPICTCCYAVRVEPIRVRAAMGRRPTCMACGEKLAIQKAKARTVAPLHKSNYVLITDPADLIGLNNKGGLVK